jgi:hypothetical protein
MLAVCFVQACQGQTLDTEALSRWVTQESYRQMQGSGRLQLPPLMRRLEKLAVLAPLPDATPGRIRAHRSGASGLSSPLSPASLPRTPPCSTGAYRPANSIQASEERSIPAISAIPATLHAECCDCDMLSFARRVTHVCDCMGTNRAIPSSVTVTNSHGDLHRKRLHLRSANQST